MGMFRGRQGWLQAGRLVGVIGLCLTVCGCWESVEPDPNKPVDYATWNGPDYDSLKSLPPETALLIASHRQKGSETNYDVMIKGLMVASDGRRVEEARATQMTEKVLNQGRNLPGSPVLSPYMLDMTEIREADLKRWVHSTFPNGQINIDTAPTFGAINFGANSVDIMGFTTLPLDTRRCPVAICPEGPTSEPQPFNIRGGLVHYLLPHFPPADGAGGGFRAGGTWKTRIPVFYPLSGLDPKMFEACRFMVYVDHRLEGYRQGPDCVLARIHYTFSGGFDSRDSEWAKRFPPDWGKYHVIVDQLTGEGSMVVDVGRGEVIWRQETSRLEIKEQHFVPPDPNRTDKTVDIDGKWEPSSKVITDEFKLQKRYPRTQQPPEMPPLP